jgi:hypothetical protein
MAALAAQGPSGQDDNPAQRPDAPGGDPLPGGLAGWRLGDPVEYLEPVITRRDPLSEAEWLAWCEATAGPDEPFDPAEWFDPDGPPPPGEDVLTAAELGGIADAVEGVARASADGARLGTAGALAVLATSAGRRGPGQPGSARVFPGESASRAAAFGTGLALDLMPGCPDLALLADAAAGEDDAYQGASDDELVGVLCAWDRLEAHAWARKFAAMAELIRRRPAADCAPEGEQRMPEAFEEFAPEELALALAESRGQAEDLLTVALSLHRKLPGTRAALRDGLISRDKAWIIACATSLLDAAEAGAAEKMVLGRAGRLTPGGLRSAIARAVIEVAPDKARKRREQAAKDARVQRWAEDSGNAALMGRELPPAEVLAADQKITAWARALKAAGLEGSMDELRARAYLDILLGKDSRPAPPAADSGADDGGNGPGTPGPAPAPGPPGGVIPAGFAGRITLTIPLATLLGLADRPGEFSGLGPIDPWLARDLAGAAAQNPRTTWYVTVTDEQGHAVGHGCARPGPKNQASRRDKPDPPGSPDPPRDTPGPGLSFTASDERGPPGGYGAWKLRTGGAGPDLLVTLDPITTDNCDHRFEAKGHNPGVKLRHLSQVRHATCTSPTCRRPAATCDFEHNVPHEAGGKTCLCNGGPKCRRDHRLKQDPRWKVDQLPDGTFRWTTPADRQYTTEPTCYPI